MRNRNQRAARRAVRQGRIVSLVFAAIGLACLGAAGVWAWAAAGARDGTFAPYLLALAAAPCTALAASLRVGAAVVQPSGAPGVGPPADAGFGWYAVAPWRSYDAVRSGALVSSALFLAIGLGVFAAYLTLHVERVTPLAVLACLGWCALTARLLWGTLVRVWVAARIADARLLVKPSAPVPGTTLHVRVEQAARRDGLAVSGLTLSLVCGRSWQELESGRLRTHRRERLIARARPGGPATITPTRSLVVEHAFAIPENLAAEGGVLRFRIEVRTHLRGPDYRSHFPLPLPADADD
jgi:hypothetical protein